MNILIYTLSQDELFKQGFWNATCAELRFGNEGAADAAFCRLQIMLSRSARRWCRQYREYSAACIAPASAESQQRAAAHGNACFRLQAATLVKEPKEHTPIIEYSFQ